MTANRAKATLEDIIPVLRFLGLNAVIRMIADNRRRRPGQLLDVRLQGGNGVSELGFLVRRLLAQRIQLGFQGSDFGCAVIGFFRIGLRFSDRLFIDRISALLGGFPQTVF